MIGRKQLVVEPAWCKGCGICATFCPKQALEIVNDKVRVRAGAACVFCGQCEMLCPDYAIYLVDADA